MPKFQLVAVKDTGTDIVDTKSIEELFYEISQHVPLPFNVDYEVRYFVNIYEGKEHTGQGEYLYTKTGAVVVSETGAAVGLRKKIVEEARRYI
jgi:hypothetical protein